MPRPEEIEAFIRATFRSVWALELLCFLRQDGEHSRSHAEMVAGLRGSDLVVLQSVEDLVAAGLVLAESDGSARYAPASKGLEEAVAHAVDLYRVSPGAVRRMIISGANPSIIDFADSFRLRKD